MRRTDRVKPKNQGQRTRRPVGRRVDELGQKARHGGKD